MQSTKTQPHQVPNFLANGGEMSELIRQYDWSVTALGSDFTLWPQSLQTTLTIMLNSAFPMFLFWGEDLICFYNDAYRPSLGLNGKHPAIGKKGKEVWADTWQFIGPLIQKVITTGKPVWFEDQLVPFHRNDKVEEVYWTFSFSPAYNDDGEIGGVFATCSETTKQVMMTKKAQDSEQRVLSIIESAPFPIGVYIGEEMRIAYINKSIRDVWGKGDDLIGKTYMEVLPELKEQRVFEQLTSVYKTGIPYHAKNQRIDLVVDGQMKTSYFNYSFTPLYDTEGKVYGVMNTAADVTELIVAKQQIQQSEENFRSMILQAPVAMCILKGPQHVVELANTSMIEIWGKPKEAVMNKPIFEALPDARAQGLEELLDNVYNTGESFYANERPVVLLRHGKEETVYQNFVYQPYKDAEGQIIGVLAISIDVTYQVMARLEIERTVNKRTEELQRSNDELRESEERYHRMIDEVEDYAIILLDKDGIIRNWNRGAQKIKGYADEEIIGKSFQVFYQEEDRESGVPLRLLEQARATGKATAEGWRVKKGGDRFWGSILITALHDAEGNVIGFSKVTRDLTEKKMADDKLKEYSAHLEFQNRELEHFAYAASHDMKEPLRKIQFYGSFLNDRISGELDKKSADYLSRILSAAKKMSDLVDNILTYSRTSSSTELLQPVDLDKVLHEILATVHDEYEPSEVTIEKDHLPTIMGIPFQCGQLLDNLIHNAIKYKHPDRDCVIQIRHTIVKGRDAGNTEVDPSVVYHKISIIDNGIGFEPQYAGKIFEIFQRLNTAPGKSGAGIGLAICKRIVLNHKGTITATGRPDEGARFDIYLPVKA